MKVKFKYEVLTVILSFFTFGCNQTPVEPTFKTVEYYEQAYFELGKYMQPIEYEKVTCVVSIESPGLLDDIGEVAEARLHYLLTRDVVVPFSSVDMQGDSNHYYIPSYGSCDEPLAITTRLIKAENPENFPKISIVPPIALLDSGEIHTNVE